MRRISTHGALILEWDIVSQPLPQTLIRDHRGRESGKLWKAEAREGCGETVFSGHSRNFWTAKEAVIYLLKAFVESPQSTIQHGAGRVSGAPTPSWGAVTVDNFFRREIQLYFFFLKGHGLWSVNYASVDDHTPMWV